MIMKHLLKWFLILFFFGQTACFATPYLAHHQLTPPTASIGDALTYTLVVTTDASCRLLSPMVFDHAPFTLLDYAVQEFDRDHCHVYQLTAQVALYELGAFEIASKNLTFLIQNSQKNLVLPTLQIKIVPLIKGTIEGKMIRDIQPQMALPIYWRGYLWLLFGIIILSAAAFVWWRWYRKRVLKPEGTEPVRIVDLRTPHEIAMADLDALLVKKLLEQRQLKQFYFCLTEILKRFLSAVCHEKILEMTTYELVRFFEPQLEITLFKRLKKVLDNSDLVKFACYEPAAQEHQENIDRVRDVIDRVWQRYQAEQVALHAPAELPSEGAA